MLWRMAACHFFHASETKEDYMKVGKARRTDGRTGKIICSLHGGWSCLPGVLLATPGVLTHTHRNNGQDLLKARGNLD